MKKLHKLQSHFKQAILSDLPQDLSRSIVEDGFSTEERLNIHRNNSLSSLSSALASNFPVICRLVGQAFFEQMARKFIRTNPLRDAHLLNFGTGFAEFIENYEPAADLTYLADMARFERQWNMIFHGPDGQSLDQNEFNRVEPENFASLKFDFLPNMAFLASPYPLWQIWQNNQEGAEDADPVHLDQGGCNLVFYRPELAVEILILPQDGFGFLNLLAAGKSLGQAAEEILQQWPGFDLQHCLGLIIQSGMIAGFELIKMKEKSYDG